MMDQLKHLPMQQNHKPLSQTQQADSLRKTMQQNNYLAEASKAMREQMRHRAQS